MDTKPERDPDAAERLHLTKEEQKEVVKQAIQEWLDGQFAKFGRWSFFGLVSFAFGVLFYLWLSGHGLKLN